MQTVQMAMIAMQPVAAAPATLRTRQLHLRYSVPCCAARHAATDSVQPLRQSSQLRNRQHRIRRVLCRAESDTQSPQGTCPQHGHVRCVHACCSLTACSPEASPPQDFRLCSADKMQNLCMLIVVVRFISEEVYQGQFGGEPDCCAVHA
jgi:hypothetical protein